MAQLRNDERLFVLLDLARRRPDVLQALAPPDLLEKFEGAESLPEKLQILLAASGVARAAVFLTSSRPLRRALVQSAFAGDLYNVIERYKMDLFELVPDDATHPVLKSQASPCSTCPPWPLCAHCWHRLHSHRGWEAAVGLRRW